MATKGWGETIMYRVHGRTLGDKKGDRNSKRRNPAGYVSAGRAGWTEDKYGERGTRGICEGYHPVM